MNVQDTSGPTWRTRVAPSLGATSAWAWRILVLVALVWVVALLLRKFVLLFVALGVALFLTALWKPLVDRLERRFRIGRLAGTWLVVLGTLALAGLVLAFIIPRFASQLDELQAAVQEAQRRAQDWLVNGPIGLDRSQVAQLDQQVMTVLGFGATPTTSSGTGEGLATVVAAGLLAVKFLTGLILSAVLAFFMTKDGDRIVAWITDTMAPHRHEPARRMGTAAWRTVSSYIQGVTLLALWNAVALTVGLLVVGVPAPFALGLLSFFGSYIPLVGAFGVGLLATLVALSSGGLTDALIIVGLAVAIEQIENHILQPLLVGHAVQLHPIVILVVVTAGGLAAGLVGAIFAVPVFAAGAAAALALRGWRAQANDGDGATASGGTVGDGTVTP